MRAPAIRLYQDEVVIDEFAGGGGASTGIEWAIGRSPDVAINHDIEALAMHAKNHPETHHIPTDVYRVDPIDATGGRPCAFAWFSPDCTYFSKARGAKPFRDTTWARRVRGLAWVVVKWARAPLPVKPRVMFIENVEEFQFWGAVKKNGRPDVRKRGQNFRRWKRAIEAEGYTVDLRELRAKHYGAPTSRKRLFIICRRDGQPIVWPKETHGPGLAPYRTAAECIDFSIPVPSIFLTPAQAKKWAKAHGLATPKRPLAAATMRRIARGIQRFVLDNPAPFIIPLTHQDYFRGWPLTEPLPTITSAARGEFALVAPTLINTRNGERKGQAPRALDIQAPYNTITAQGSQGALVQATLILNNSEQRSDRVYSADEPIRTLTAHNARTYQLVAAFLAKHNAGNEATGQKLTTPIDTVTTRDSKALVTSHLVHLRGGVEDHPNTSTDVREPLPTITAQGTHVAEVRAFLLKYYGSKKDGITLGGPLDTVTTKERFGLVTVTIAGEQYAIVDIGMRMLTPRELFRAQGFPADYHIDDGVHPTLKLKMRFTKKTQTRLVGNSVPPHLAAALIRANMTEAAA